MTVTWPAALEARAWNANLRNMMASGGRTPTGRDQRVFSDAGFWEIAITGIRIHNREEAAAYRAMVARLRAGEDILVPLREVYTVTGANLAAAEIRLAADADLRATQIGITAEGVQIEAGYHFTVGDRLHVITEVMTAPLSPPLVNQFVTGGPISSKVPFVSAVTASAAYTVKILPPLRADYSSGEGVRFRDLLVRCVIKDPSDGDLDLDLGRLGTPSLTFIESL